LSEYFAKIRKKGMKMGKFDALFEDEDDIFAGSPVSKYWDIVGQAHEDLRKDEFDRIVERIAAMEQLLSQTHEYEDLDKMIKSYCLTNHMEMENLKKSVYMELAGKMVYRLGE